MATSIAATPDFISDTDIQNYEQPAQGGAPDFISDEDMNVSEHPAFIPDETGQSVDLLQKGANIIDSTEKKLIGSGETLANVFSGFVTAGAAGAAALPYAGYEWVKGGDPLSTFKDMYESSAQKWGKYTTYQPQTEEGQSQQKMVEGAFHWFDEKAKGMGNAVFEETGSPEAATATYMIPHVALLFGPKVAGVASDAIGGKLATKRAVKQRQEFGYDEALPEAVPKEPVAEGTIAWEAQPEFKNPIAIERETFDSMYEKAYPRPKEEAEIPAWEAEREVNWRAYGQAEKLVEERIYKTAQTNAIEEIRTDTNLELRNAEKFGEDAGFIPLEERAGSLAQIPGPRDQAIPGYGVRPVLDVPGPKRVELKEGADQFSLEEQAANSSRPKALEFDEVWQQQREMDNAWAKREYEDSYRKGMDEELAYLERDNFLAEERVQDVIRNSNVSIPQPQARKGQFALKQSGQLDISVFAEGLRKTTKSIDEFTQKLVEEYGPTAKAIAPLLWKSSENTVEKAEAPIISGKATRPYKRSPGVASRVIEYMGGRAIPELNKKAVDSPTLQSVMDRIEHPEWAPGARQRVTPSDLTESRLLRQGEFHKRYTDAITHVEKKVLAGARTVLTGRIPKELNDMMVKHLATGKGAYGRSLRAAEQIRALLDDVYKYAAEAGVEVKSYLKDYFPYRIEISKLAKAKNREGFIALLQRHTGLDPIEARNLVNDLVSGDGLIKDKFDVALRENVTGAVLHGRGIKTRYQAKASSIERSRKLLSQIPYEELAPFLDKDINSVIPKYIETVVRRVEIAKLYGPKYEKLATDLIQAHKELQAKGTDISPWEMERIFDLIDAYQHTYKPYENVRAVGAERVAHTLMNVKTLPLVVLSSLSEAAIPLAWAGPKAFIPSVFKAVMNEFNEGMRSIYKDLPKTEWEELSEILMKSTDIGTLERIASIYNSDVSMVNAAFFKVVGQQAWTKFTNIIAQESFRSMFSNLMKKMDNGSKLQSYEIDMKSNTLRWFGMDEKAALAWWKKGMPKEDKMYGEYKKAALRFIHHSVPISRPAVRPLWHSNPHPLARMVAHLKGFPSLYGNTIMKNMALQLYDQMNAKGIYGMSRRSMNIAMSVGLGMWLIDQAWSIKDELSNRETKHKDLPWGKRMERNFEGIGGYGILSSIMMASRAKADFGGSFLGTLAGPTPNAIETFFEAAYDMKKDKPSNRAMARWIVQNMVVPGQFYSKETRTEQYDAIENVLDNISPEAKKSLVDEITEQLKIKL